MFASHESKLILEKPRTKRSGGLKQWEMAVTTLAINLLSLAVPIMTLQVYDRILVQQGVGTLTMLVIGVGAVVVIECLLSMARSYVIGMHGAGFEHHTNVAALKSLLSSDIATSEKRNVGDYAQDLSAIAKLKDFYSGQTLVTMMDIPFILIFIGLIAYLSGWLVIVPATLLGLFAVLAWFVGHHLKDTLEARDDCDNRRFNLVIEALQGIHSIKALALEAPFTRRYEQLQAEASMGNFRVAEIGGIASNMGNIFAQIMMVAVAAAAAPLVIHQYISTGTMIACVLLSGRVMQPVQRGLTLWSRFQDYRLAEQKLHAIFSMPSAEPDITAPEVENIGRLSCDAITYSTHPDAQPMLEDIHLRIEPGEAVALHGEHSSGKSTLLEIIAGLRKPIAGTVIINGMDIGAMSSSERMRHIAYMPTTGTIFRGTIMENLCGFQPQNQPRALEISALLGIHDLVSRLPLGYETELEGEQMDIIPPGLKQRIAIARVLVEKPRILLFDNADRALDKKGYNYVFTLFGKLKGRVSMLLVSEDRNLLSLADRHYTLEGGHLEEQRPRVVRTKRVGNTRALRENAQ